jgi:hypothetical protein
MFQKKSEGEHRPSIGMPVIDKLEDRSSFWSTVTRQKIARNLKLISNSGFFVRGCQICENEFQSRRNARRSSGWPLSKNVGIPAITRKASASQPLCRPLRLLRNDHE